jgi:hypothetical protein
MDGPWFDSRQGLEIYLVSKIHVFNVHVFVPKVRVSESNNKIFQESCILTDYDLCLSLKKIKAVQLL